MAFDTYRLHRYLRTRCLSSIFAPCLMALIVSLCPCSSQAWAEDLDTNPEPDEFQQEVERTAAEYESAIAQVDAAKTALEENRARLSELEAVIPEQQERSDTAARELYKIEQQGSGIVEMLLSSESFSDFISNFEYVSRASDANIVEINRLAAMQADLESTQSELKQAKRDADAHAEEASAALAAAQEARREAQRRAQEEAERRAAEEAAARAAAEAEAAQQESEGDAETPADEDAEQAKPEAEESEADEAEQQSAPSEDTAEAAVETPTADGADWTSDQAAFITEWGARIDAYLDGSPLAGQGRTFASAAWSYGVDPRWSPAISFTESSKGAACFAAHNAWGWGSESWGSWEEAIDAHVRGLARGYGYTISVEAAQKYCPPNWQSWYDRTLEQMNLI